MRRTTSAQNTKTEPPQYKTQKQKSFFLSLFSKQSVRLYIKKKAEADLGQSEVGVTVMVLVSSGYSLGSPEMNNNTECARKQGHQNVNAGMQIQKPACFNEMWTGGQMDEWGQGGGVMERWMGVEGRKKAIGQVKDGIQTQAEHDPPAPVQHTHTHTHTHTRTHTHTHTHTRTCTHTYTPP